MGAKISEDCYEELHLVEDHRSSKRASSNKFAVGSIFFVFLGLATFSSLYIFQNPLPRLKTSPPACTLENSRTRREWRRFSDEEKDVYLGAVRCLQQAPGRISNEHSLFDDFAFSHSRTGKASHNSALFLPWHRLFLIAFEETLRSHCNYSGDFPYWDWSLDYEHGLSQAPVWDVEHGFGGNGTSLTRLANGLKAVGNGSCVTSGPFMNQTVLYYSYKKKAHCLSRGFVLSNSNASNTSHQAIHPGSIEEILSQQNYSSFWNTLELGPHDAIPHFIRGDFSFLTAPNDPVFFLHHSQLDRLWWTWQMGDVPERLTEYDGHTNSSSDEAASLADTIHLGGLWPDAHVESVMDTMGKFLCYKYE